MQVFDVCVCVCIWIWESSPTPSIMIYFPFGSLYSNYIDHNYWPEKNEKEEEEDEEQEDDVIKIKKNEIRENSKEYMRRKLISNAM